MLAVDFFSRPAFHSPPSRRSPLDARDPNICSTRSSPATFMSSGEKPSKTRPSEPRKRESKFAPLLRRKDDRGLRRNAYLSKGKTASEDKRFDARADQSLRLQWIEEQRQWQEQKAQEEAAQFEVDPDFELPGSSTQEFDNTMDGLEGGDAMMQSDDEEAFQYYLFSQQQQRNQDQDIDLPDLSQPPLSQTTHTQPMDFWSDDDEFEQSLLEAALVIERAPDWNSSMPATAREEDMDVSMG